MSHDMIVDLQKLRIEAETNEDFDTAMTLDTAASMIENNRKFMDAYAEVVKTMARHLPAAHPITYEFRNGGDTFEVDVKTGGLARFLCHKAVLRREQ